ncbi:hypothetical protein N7490_001844 [Penicillium lividum]|nr:hypothetical protein N7490_001844 [Penicillium lividum]
MGIAESKILAVKLTTACSNAERNGHNQVRDLLFDKQFIKCLANLWLGLPEGSKQEIVPTSHKPSKNTRKRKKPQDQSIELSKPLKDNLALWGKDHRSFLDITLPSCPAKTCPIAAVYRNLTHVETRTAGDTIRLRFLKVLLHHLKQRLCVTYLRTNAVQWMAYRVTAAGLGDSDLGSISENIKDWAYVGGRYDALCEELGEDYDVSVDYKYLGNLFRLPDDVSDRFVAKELKVKDKVRRRVVIDSLISRGVCSQPGLSYSPTSTGLDSEVESITEYPSYQGAVPQIDPMNADYPSTAYSGTDYSTVAGGVPQIDPMNAEYPSVVPAVPQIDPMNADYPSTAYSGTNYSTVAGGVPQIDPMNAEYPSVVPAVPQIDPMNADYPSIAYSGTDYSTVAGGVPQIDPMNAEYPSVVPAVPQIDPMNADYPSTAYSGTNYSTVAGGVPQIDPMNAEYPSVVPAVPRIDPMNADYPSIAYLSTDYRNVWDDMPQIDPGAELHLENNGQCGQDCCVSGYASSDPRK